MVAVLQSLLLLVSTSSLGESRSRFPMWILQTTTPSSVSIHISAIAFDFPHVDRPVHVQSLAILATSARSSPSPNELQNENGQINGQCNHDSDLHDRMSFYSTDTLTRTQNRTPFTTVCFSSTHVFFALRRTLSDTSLHVAL